MAVEYDLKDADVGRAAKEVFFKIKAKLDFIDDEPVTAFMIMKKDVIWSAIRGNTHVLLRATLYLEGTHQGRSSTFSFPQFMNYLTLPAPLACTQWTRFVKNYTQP